MANFLKTTVLSAESDVYNSLEGLVPVDGDQCYVQAPNRFWQFYGTSTATPDGNLVVLPAGQSVATPGRWIVQGPPGTAELIPGFPMQLFSASLGSIIGAPFLVSNEGETGQFQMDARANWMLVILTGTGGCTGGAICDATADRTVASSGGSAGATALKLISRTNFGSAAQAYTLGTRGLGGTPGNNGTAGTNSTFGDSPILTAPTGVSSVGVSATGTSPSASPKTTGPVAVGGDINMKGEDGEAGIGWHGVGHGPTDYHAAVPGLGGSSFWGGRAASEKLTFLEPGTAAAPGVEGGSPGAGASGAGAINSTTGASGARGGRGLLYVVQFGM